MDKKLTNELVYSMAGTKTHNYPPNTEYILIMTINPMPFRIRKAVLRAWVHYVEAISLISVALVLISR